MLVRAYLASKVELKSAIANFSAIALVTVTEKFESFPRASASSLRVSKAPGAASIKSLIYVVTYSLLTASESLVGAPTLVIWLLFMFKAALNTPKFVNEYAPKSMS